MIGFGMGQWAGQAMGLSFFRIGQLHIVETALGAFLLLFLVRTLNLERSSP
jgi:uncharacterized membrane protein YeaQ/YmgE (transglycosylase-associated protein family)